MKLVQAMPRVVARAWSFWVSGRLGRAVRALATRSSMIYLGARTEGRWIEREASSTH